MSAPSSPSKGQVLATVNFAGRKKYILDFEIKTLGLNSVWTNVLRLGNKNQDKSPAIFIPSNERRLYIRQISSKSTGVNTNDGCDPSESVTPPLNEWYRVTITANEDILTVHYNDVIRCSKNMNIVTPVGLHKFYLSCPINKEANVLVRNLAFNLI